jgi:3-oxoacyl-[acyl-carrier protein] reductase
MDLGLHNARAFVAGSRSGLGAATARQLSREGAQVVINGRNIETLRSTAEAIQTETGNRIIPLAADLSNPDKAFQIVQQAGEQLGGLDILVTNSGGPPAGPFESLTVEHFDQAHRLLVVSTVQMIKAALPFLRQSNQPAILAITSLSIKQPVDGLLLSNSIRMAVAGLVKTLCNELGPKGIRLNAILPGWTATERVEELLAGRAERNSSSIETERETITQNIPLRRMGQPDDFGNVAAFLCSPAAAYIHGAMIPVDGGSIKATL